MLMVLWFGEIETTRAWGEIAAVIVWKSLENIDCFRILDSLNFALLSGPLQI